MDILSFVLVLSVIITTTFAFHQRLHSEWQNSRNRIFQSSSEINDNPYQDPKLQEFLQGDGINTAWKGSTEILRRRKQIPSNEYDPQTVVNKCMQALQANDDPQLDHGCCVLLAFKSPFGLLSQGGLDPGGYGRFLRSTNYNPLIDNADFQLIGELIYSKDSLSVRQRVQVNGWNIDGNINKSLFDFYLSKNEDKWLVDVVLAIPENSN